MVHSLHRIERHKLVSTPWTHQKFRTFLSPCSQSQGPVMATENSAWSGESDSQKAVQKSGSPGYQGTTGKEGNQKGTLKDPNPGRSLWPSWQGNPRRKAITAVAGTSTTTCYQSHLSAKEPWEWILLRVLLPRRVRILNWQVADSHRDCDSMSVK